MKPILSLRLAWNTNRVIWNTNGALWTANRAILLHTTLKWRNMLWCRCLYECSVSVGTTRTLHDTTLNLWSRLPADFFLGMAQYCPRLGNIVPSLSIKRYVVIRLKPRWISSKPYVNFKRGTRKHYLSLKPIWNEAYFIGKWSLFQWRMKLLSKANETTFNSQWNYFQ